MRRSLFLLLGFLMVAATAIAGSNYGRHHHGSRNISFDDDEFASTDCSSMRVTFDDERVPIVSENVPVGNPRALKIRSAQNGGVRIVGGAPAYSVKACKAAGMNTDASQIRVNFNGDEVTASGPDDDNWVVYFIVQTPRAATVSVTANNGPISVSDFDGTLNARATNGPVSVRDSSGTIDASTQNGPISIDGGSGNVKASAQNGPLSVKLDGASWNGSLDGSTQNGPLTVKLPRGYRSGVIVESRGHGPVSCHAEGCRDAMVKAIDRDGGYDDGYPRRIEFGSGPANVHLSTVNGPLSVKDRD